MERLKRLELDKRLERLETLFLSYGAFLLCAWLTFSARPAMVWSMLAVLVLVTALYIRWRSKLFNYMLLLLPVLFMAICCWS